MEVRSFLSWATGRTTDGHPVDNRERPARSSNRSVRKGKATGRFGSMFGSGRQGPVRDDRLRLPFASFVKDAD
ncbi:MAG: hypothetical protein FJW26_08300 [Acidimicrobiia bacterium]|nr:hypothetical protein [Acidimicrobiia bacterium]